MPLPISLTSVYNEHDQTCAAILTILGFAFWILAYVFVIYRSAIDHYHGVPMVAVCLNVTWEFIFAVVCPGRQKLKYCRGQLATFCPGELPSWQLWVLRAWLALDTVILVQLLWWGARYQVPRVQHHFLGFVIGGLLLAYFGQLTFMIAREDDAGTHMAWLGNLVMSVLFLVSALERSNHLGLSYAAAWAKLFGSASFAAGMICGRSLAQRSDLKGHPLISATEVNVNLTFLFASVLLFDLAYIYYLT